MFNKGNLSTRASAQIRGSGLAHGRGQEDPWGVARKAMGKPAWTAWNMIDKLTCV